MTAAGSKIISFGNLHPHRVENFFTKSQTFTPLDSAQKGGLLFQMGWNNLNLKTTVVSSVHKADV